MRTVYDKHTSAFDRGVGPVEAVVGLGYRTGYSAELADSAPSGAAVDTDDLLIPQAIGCWTNQWLAGLGTR